MISKPLSDRIDKHTVRVLDPLFIDWTIVRTVEQRVDMQLGCLWLSGELANFLDERFLFFYIDVLIPEEYDSASAD